MFNPGTPPVSRGTWVGWTRYRVVACVPDVRSTLIWLERVGYTNDVNEWRIGEAVTLSIGDHAFIGGGWFSYYTRDRRPRYTDVSWIRRISPAGA